LTGGTRRSNRPPVLLTIAGFDPSSGAGITADLSVFAAHGSFGISCPTALTVQSTRGVRAVQQLEAAFVASTLACLDDDLPPDGIKIGMLGSAAVVAAVADYIDSLGRKIDSLGRDIPIVLDPVLRSSSGAELLEPAGVGLLLDRLLPLVSWTTPNISELEALSGVRVNGRDAVEVAARELQQRFPRLTVLTTGGHLEPPDDLLAEPGGRATWLPGVRIDSHSTHGTGCALSSGLLAQLVQGKEPADAARAAKEFVAEAIRRAPGLGGGNGPLDLLWPVR